MFGKGTWLRVGWMIDPNSTGAARTAHATYPGSDTAVCGAPTPWASHGRAPGNTGCCPTAADRHAHTGCTHPIGTSHGRCRGSRSVPAAGRCSHVPWLRKQSTGYQGRTVQVTPIRMHPQSEWSWVGDVL